MSDATFVNAVKSAEPAVDNIPTKIIKEPPLPIPFSVINSDIHITRTEPAVSVITDET